MNGSPERWSLDGATSWVERWLTSPAALKASWIAAATLGRSSARLSAPFVSRLWFTPWRLPVSDSAREREAGWLAGTRPLTIAWHGRELHGYITGAGPTVLLVHGWGSRAAAMGALVGPLRASGFRVAAIDLPGHGDTGGLDANAYVMGEALVAAAEEFRPQAVVSHSFGSLVLLEAARRGLRVDRAVMIAPAVRLEHAVTTFGAEFQVPERALDGLRTAIERRFGPSVWDEFALDTAGSDLDLPVLIAHDADDARVSVHDAELLHEGLPQTELLVTHGLGHDRILGSPEVVARAVAFLSDNPIDPTSTRDTGRLGPATVS